MLPDRIIDGGPRSTDEMLDATGEAPMLPEDEAADDELDVDDER